MPDHGDDEIIKAAGSIGLGVATSDSAGAKVLEFLKGGKIDGRVKGSAAVGVLLGDLAASVLEGKLLADSAVVLLKDSAGNVRLFMAGPSADGELKFYDAFGMMGVGHMLLARLTPP